LLKALSEVEEIDWIRLHYAYPAGFPMDAIEEMARNPKICNYLDIPLQHINDEMLKRMRRGTTRAKTDRIIEEMRTVNPEMAIRTTLITGFPGETEAHFQEMYDWVASMKFDRLGVFTYSHEENTHAFQYEDDVSAEVKQERANAIMNLQEEISFERNQSRIGTVEKVLIDRKEGGFFIGRTQYDSPEVDNEVVIDASENYLRLGDFVNVRITGNTAFDLEAEVIQS